MALTKEIDYEFGGPVGAALISVLLPLVSVLLNEVCALPSFLGDRGAANVDLDGSESASMWLKVQTKATSILSAITTIWNGNGSVEIMTASELIESSSCCSITSLPNRLKSQLVTLMDMNAIFSPASLKSAVTAIAVVIGYLFVMLALHVILPGTIVQGALLRNGKRLRYKLNAMSVLIVSVVAFLSLSVKKIIDPVYVFDNVSVLMAVGIAFCYLMSIWLYCRARAKVLKSESQAKEKKSYSNGYNDDIVKNKDTRDVILAEGGNTGNVIYDYFIGHELNPRICIKVPFGRVIEVDLKEFCELTPGLIAWLLLDLCCAFKQLALHGYLSNAMILVIVFHAIYVLDGLYLEKAILTTMDITTDGFGFMLVFGDLVWVPFTYSLQARYLAIYPSDLSIASLLLIVVLKIVGYYAFRGSNNQKNAFRTFGHDHPKNRHIRYIDTQRGTRLMISGWWGIARHINYTGDWLMGLSWSLPCGFQHIIPYFYPIYFACLLLHREGRDEHLCYGKYGQDWDKYKKIVKYRLVPGLY